MVLEALEDPNSYRNKNVTDESSSFPHRKYSLIHRQGNSNNDENSSSSDDGALEYARNYSIGLHQLLETNNNSHDNVTRTFTKNNVLFRVASYYAFQEQNLHWLAAPLASADGSVSTISIQYKHTENEEEDSDLNPRIIQQALLESIQQYTAAQYNPSDNHYYFTVKFTGWDYLQRDSRNLLYGWKTDLVVWLSMVLAMTLMTMMSAERGGSNSRQGFSWYNLACGPLGVSVCCWMTSLALYSMLMAILTKLGAGHNDRLGQEPALIKSLVVMGCCIQTILFASTAKANSGDDEVDTTSSDKLMATLIALLLGYSMIYPRGAGLSTTLFIVTALILQWTMPFLMTTMLTSKQTPARNLQDLSSDDQHLSTLLIRTSPEMFHEAYDDGKDDHFDIEESPEQQHQHHHHHYHRSIHHHQSPGAYLENRVPLTAPKSIWIYLSKHLLLHPYRGVIAGLIFVQLAFTVGHSSIHCFSTSSIALESLLDNDSDALLTWNKVRDSLHRPGHVAPYRLVFDGHGTNISMTTAPTFEIMHIVVDELIAIEHEHDDSANRGATHIGMTSFEARELAKHIGAVVRGELEEGDDEDGVRASTSGNSTNLFNDAPHHRRAVYNGIAVMQNTRLPHSVYFTAKYCHKMKPYCPFELLHAIDVLDQWDTSEDTLTTVVNIELGVDPFSEEGLLWLESARSTLERLDESGVLNGVNVQLHGAAATEHDSVMDGSKFTSRILFIIGVVVTISMGVYFQSVFVALMSLMSVAFTLALAFGAGSVLLKHTGNVINWQLSAVSALLAAFLSLVFNLHLVSRVQELRKYGYEHQSAIAAGYHVTASLLCQTSTVISVAFFVYALFSSNPLLKQCSTIITFASLLDALLVRCILVPIAMNLAGPWLCWWPSSTNETHGTIRLQGFENDDFEDLSEVMRNFEASSEYVSLTPGTRRM